MAETSDSFVHLHVHSQFSLLDGACRTADLPKRAKELGMSSVAVTDHGVLYGAVEFYRNFPNLKKDADGKYMRVYSSNVGSSNSNRLLAGSPL